MNLMIQGVVKDLGKESRGGKGPYPQSMYTRQDMVRNQGGKGPHR